MVGRQDSGITQWPKSLEGLIMAKIVFSMSGKIWKKNISDIVYSGNI